MNVPITKDVTTPEGPPPGWYDDGVTADLQRWFDGTDWTEHTRPLPESALRPAPSTARTTGPAHATTGGTAPGSWAAASGGVWLPAAPFDDVEREQEPESTSPGWWGPGGADWGASGGRSRFGSL